MNLTNATTAAAGPTPKTRLASAEVLGGGPVEYTVRLTFQDGHQEELTQTSGNLPDPKGIKTYMNVSDAQADVATLNAAIIAANG